MKRTINIISLVCHALILALGVTLSITANTALGEVTGGEALESGVDLLGAVIGSTAMVLVFVLALVYSLFAFIPTLLKLIRVLGGGRTLDAFAIVFSVFLLLLNTAVALAISGTGQAVFLGAAIASALSLVLNVISSTG